MNRQNATLEESNNAELQAGRVWETPTIEEVDLASTEASATVYGGVDGGIYHS
jgi:hypothetical protein